MQAEGYKCPYPPTPFGSAVITAPRVHVEAYIMCKNGAGTARQVGKQLWLERKAYLSLEGFQVYEEANFNRQCR